MVSVGERGLIFNYYYYFLLLQAIEALRGMMCQKVCAASQFSVVLTAGGKVNMCLCTCVLICSSYMTMEELWKNYCVRLVSYCVHVTNLLQMLV